MDLRWKLVKFYAQAVCAFGAFFGAAYLLLTLHATYLFFTPPIPLEEYTYEYATGSVGTYTLSPYNQAMYEHLTAEEFAEKKDVFYKIWLGDRKKELVQTMIQGVVFAALLLAVFEMHRRLAGRIR